MRGLLLGVALVVLAACGGGQTGVGVFSTTWDDDGGASIEAVRQRLSHVAIPAGFDVAVAVAAHNTKLLGQPLSGGPRWSFAHGVDSQPLVAGRVVVGSGDGELFALDAATGRALWRRPTGGLLLDGAGDDGTVTVVTLADSIARGSTLIAVSHDGEVLRQIERPVEFGHPAVVSRLAFVPWNSQYVSVLDVTDGVEVGRLVLPEQTSRAWITGGALYFGEHGLYRFDEKIRLASRGGADHVSLPAKDLPGHPTLFRPAAEPTKPIAGAAEKVRLYARPTSPGEPLAIDGGRFYATYFRLVFGLSVDDAKLAWVHTHPNAVLGGAAIADGVLLCDADGKLTTLDAANGAESSETLSMGEPIESCVVQADGLRRAGPVTTAAPLTEQIRVAVSDRDLALAAGQEWLLRELAASPADASTEVLVKMAADTHLPSSELDEVRAALASRRTGARSLEAALDAHYDFLHDVLLCPPVGPIARALAAMNDTHAEPALLRHLFDPADGEQDLRDVAQAVAALARPADVPALLRFFALYRDAPAESEAIPQAVNAIGDALLRVGGPEGKATVMAAVRRSGTNPVVRAKLAALVEAQGLQRGTPSITPSSTSRE